MTNKREIVCSWIFTDSVHDAEAIRKLQLAGCIVKKFARHVKAGTAKIPCTAVVAYRHPV